MNTNDVTTAVGTVETTVTPSPTKRTWSEERRKRYETKKATPTSLTPLKSKGMTRAIQILEMQKASVKVARDQKITAIKAECEEVLESFDELIADAKAKTLLK